MNRMEELLSQPVNLDDLIEKLDFSEENVIQANREQATLYLEASRYRVKKMRGRIRAESKFEAAKTEAAMILRQKKRSGEKGSITEGYIKDRVATNPHVHSAKRKFEDAVAYEEMAKLLLETYRQRGRAIQTLAEILGAEAHAQARQARRDIEEAGLDQLRRQVKRRFEARRERDE